MFDSLSLGWLVPSSVAGALGMAVVVALGLLVWRYYGTHTKDARAQQVVANAKHAEELPRVFVALPTLGLDQVVETLVSMLDNAFAPRNLTVGVLCSDPPQADILAMYKQQANLPFETQVLVQYSLDEAAGPNVARAETLDAFFTGQDFVLYTDAHTTFEKNWDQTLFEEWTKCKNPRAIITGIPASTPDELPVFCRWSDNPEHCKSREPELLPQLFARRPSPFQKPMPNCGCVGRFAYGPGSLLAHKRVRQTLKNVPGYEGGDLRLTLALHALGARFFSPVRLPVLQQPVARSRGISKAKTRPPFPPVDADAVRKDLKLLATDDGVILTKEALQGQTSWLNENERGFRFGYVRL